MRKLPLPGLKIRIVGSARDIGLGEALENHGGVGGRLLPLRGTDRGGIGVHIFPREADGAIESITGNSGEAVGEDVGELEVFEMAHSCGSTWFEPGLCKESSSMCVLACLDVASVEHW